MGYASYLEDIRARLAEDLAQLQHGIDAASAAPRPPALSSVFDQHFAAVVAIHRQCKAVLTEVEKLLEIATYPELEMAHELLLLRNEVSYLRTRSDRLDDEHRMRVEAEQKLRDTEAYLQKRQLRKHYIKGEPTKKAKKTRAQ